MANYEVWLTNDFGVRLALLDNFTSLSVGKSVNQIANFTMTLPLSFDRNLIKADQMIQVWREPQGGSLSIFNVYFLRRWVFQHQGSNEIITIAGPNLNDLLRRRNAIGYSGSGTASKADFADDMLKEILSEATSDSTTPTPDAGTRVWNDLSIQADFSAGPVLVRNLEWGKLLNSGDSGIFADLAKASRAANNEVFFGIYPNVISSNAITLQFRTTTGQPGQDVSTQVTFSQEEGNLKNPSLEYDYSNEANYVYAGGQGEGSSRNIQQSGDSSRYNISQWNRCEAFIDARDQTSNDGVLDAADRTLTEGKPRIHFTGEPVDTEGTRFGVDWNFGDKVRTSYANIQFDSIIRNVTINVDNSGMETVNARLDFEETI